MKGFIVIAIIAAMGVGIVSYMYYSKESVNRYSPSYNTTIR